ncbi:MAG TPA: DNA-binding protein [Candidatus Lambdaproteobacteria bacterium]|jgi:excisionase family DNA binding protein|nr:DNA-binding protein [Candidatus Lambdaproteobacteria bacterium]|tara:strand:+ start:224 stop:433 length:210 start_codon:yes stop_codon:yes gene_type:complete
MNKDNENLEALSARLISVEEAAELIKIKKGTLQNWLSQGSKFKRVKIGGRTFIDRLEVEDLLQVALSGK